MYKTYKMYIMTRTVTATELKVKTSEILDDVAFNKTTSLIERNGRLIAKLVPLENYANRENRVRVALKDSFGSIPDFPLVKRYKSRRPIPKFD